MIIIYQSTSNTVALTLTEKTTITSPYYLFSFTNVTTNLEKNFLSTDLSCGIERFNKFTIVEPTDVELIDEGQWSYVIYAQTSAVNTDPSLADEVVETGMVTVIDPTPSTDKEYTQTDTDKQYEPE